MDNKLLLFVLVSSIACVDFIQAGVLDRETYDDETLKNLKECGFGRLVIEPQMFLDPSEADKLVRKAKCSTSCLFKKAGVITDDNKLYKAVVERMNPNDLGGLGLTCTDFNFYDQCSHVRDRDECEYAYKVMECFASVCDQNKK